VRPARKRLNAIQQLLALRSRYPDGDARLSRGRVVWTGTLRPTPASIAYTVRIEYCEGQQPHVFVVDPPLEDFPDDSIPHTYSPTEMCLYYPGEFDQGREFIADTIVPWASEWLLFYELWLITKEWHGGGIHPADEHAKASGD
jgi:hypothetical protein